MRIATGAVSTTMTLVVAILVSGCAPSQPVITPVPAASSTPVFASDDDALKAAEVAYRAFVRTADEILAQGGANPDRIDGVATEKVAAVEKEGFATFVKQGYHSVGRTTFQTPTLQQVDSAASNGISIVSIYVCSDVSAVDILDTTGKSIVGQTRPALTAFQIGFDLRNSSSPDLVVSSKDVWPGTGVCK